MTTREKKLFLTLFVAFIISGLSITGQWLYAKSTIAPAQSGEYIEGLVGSPIYVNPVIAQTNDVDMDLSSLIFSSLLKYDKDQKLVNDLAENYTISEDQKVYTFEIKKQATWQDKIPITADDVIFTIKTIKDQQYKSPLQPSLQSADVQKISDSSFKLTLKKPFALFPTLLTFGILPEHVWSSISPSTFSLAEFNIKPIGSGPWQFKSLAKDKQGLIKTYSLLRNPLYYGTKPNLEKLTFKFYSDISDLLAASQSKEIMGINFVSKKNAHDLPKTFDTFSLHLPQYTALFLNQKKNEFLKDIQVRKALALAINRPELVSQALNEDGYAIDAPILPGFIGYKTNIETYNQNLDLAKKTLDKAGWKEISDEDYKQFQADEKTKAEEAEKKANKSTSKKVSALATENLANSSSTLPVEPVAPAAEEKSLFVGQEFFRKKQNDILQINLTTVATSEDQKAAELITGYWQKLGIKVNLVLVDGNKIKKETIDPRNYDVLLYGEVIGSDPDLYPFWHSSQIEQPGLNLSLFQDKEADRLLVDAREIADVKKREADYYQFQDILAKQLPAIFLYSQTYTYALDNRIKGFGVDKINTPSDRFSNLNEWYLKTKRVFKF